MIEKNDLNLNIQQEEAVLHTEGPLLVLAGAGTGKTKVLTSRIAHIVESSLAYPSQLLVVTFTNKAASEMKTRTISQLNLPIDGMWIGTFHSIAAKILRRHSQMMGLTEDFTIIDQDDQLKLIKQILKDLNIETKPANIKDALRGVSRFKDKAWTVDKVPQSEIGLQLNGKMMEIYTQYQQNLLSLNAVDFGDLTLLNIELFNQHTDILHSYQKKFKYILVDEYQDTNIAQYLWLRMLAQLSHNICCVGDDDQSIYGWRGAEITNILRFEQDFINAKIIRLEKNYRSTNHILNAATHLIEHNKQRHGKALWTEIEDGHKIKVACLYDDRGEAQFVVNQIASMFNAGFEYSKMAVLIRAGHQSRILEEYFNRMHLPYKIVGGIKFYERSEVKDVISYVRLLLNPNDTLSFDRIVNVPKRSIGKASLDKIFNTAKTYNLTYYEAIDKLIISGIIKGKAKTSLIELINIIKAHRNMLDAKSNHALVVESILEAISYSSVWKDMEDYKERMDNIKEIIRSIHEFPSLSSYLEHISLVMESDSIESSDYINIMTIHAAKGLEFDIVFLVGWEDGLFPSQRAIDSKSYSAIEEERRLAYVAITRAKKHLYISYSQRRKMYGGISVSYPSRFLSELPKNSISMAFSA